MVNRQARREQSRTTRTNRGGGGSARRPSSTRGPQRSSSGGGAGEFFSRPFVWIVGAVIVAAVAVIAAVMILGDGGSDGDLVSQLETAHTNLATLPEEMFDGTRLGDPDAPLKLVAFEDFQCPFCLLYTAEDEPIIVEEYIKTGKVQLEFRNLPILGTESTKAAVAGECAAEQNRFWDYHSHLFLVQARAGQVSNERIDAGRFSDQKLREYAEEIGLDLAAFDTCYTSSEALEHVTADSAEANQRGIRGTPNFVINGQTAGSDFGNADNWRSQLDNVLEQLAASPTASPTGASATPAATATP